MATVKKRSSVKIKARLKDEKILKSNFGLYAFVVLFFKNLVRSKVWLS